MGEKNRRYKRNYLNIVRIYIQWASGVGMTDTVINYSYGEKEGGHFDAKKI